MAEQRDMSGILFKNNRKAKPTHPDYRGEIMIAGVEYDLSAWLKQGAKGTFMSLAVTPKSDRQQRADAPPANQGREPIPDNDIPFDTARGEPGRG